MQDNAAWAQLRAALGRSDPSAISHKNDSRVGSSKRFTFWELQSSWYSAIYLLQVFTVEAARQNLYSMYWLHWQTWQCGLASLHLTSGYPGTIHMLVIVTTVSPHDRSVFQKAGVDKDLGPHDCKILGLGELSLGSGVWSWSSGYTCPYPTAYIRWLWVSSSLLKALNFCTSTHR